ncbi:hypothetical protein B0A48_02741 [Cryoendolithus antarcticus]|uniref:Uncharacterized protein n=1 Tax=Cryoendolithus antarcticus TaxID=1507870 RepID=A0A1V8TLJ6_9PEZI|nr:hypothetical protein B0A48_02741 [Cryoendolithus antarcticus]
MVLDIGKDSGPSPKCYVHHANLPNYIDNAHPPTKKDPFRTVLEQPVGHTLDVLVPAQHTEALTTLLATTFPSPIRYAKVHMKLHDVLTGEFFNDYVKSGNVLLLSEGRPGIDNCVSLVEGVLRLDVDKPTYERLGLEGKAVGGMGRKHVKARYVVELDLRLPSMVRGKRGFERVLWAAKHVLDHSLTWLFYDLNGGNEGSGPIAAHSPVVREVKPTITPLAGVRTSTFPYTIGEDDDEEAAELLEWLTLTMMGSPRVLETDKVDPYLCRYSVPTLTADGSQTIQDLTHFRWHGFIPSQVSTKILLAALKVSGDDWMAMSGSAFDGNSYTILKHGKTVTTWKYSD